MMFPRTIKIFRSVCLTAALLCLFIWLSSAITLGIADLAQYAGGTIGTYLIDKGAARIMRRVLLVGAVIILVLSLKKFGWQGWKDCGWTQPETGVPRRWVQFLQGIFLGAITIGSIAALSIIVGPHKLIAPAENGLQLTGLILAFSVSGLLVALIEETICRGILFRVFARAWNAWIAALVISIIFASAHFAGPSNAAFQGNSFFAVTLNLTVATLKSFLPPFHALIQFINLTLLGIVLCAFVMRTKTIWMSVGAHAAWVLIIKLHSDFTILPPTAPSSIWLGKENNFTDSLAAVLAFIALILLTFWKNIKTGLPIRVRGQLWNIYHAHGVVYHAPGVVMPSATDKLDNFIKTGEDLFSTGNVLKTYPGCRVISKDGLVFKKYHPKNFINSLRFAFRQPRSRRVFRLAGALIARGLPTPPILAWSAERCCGLLRSEAMIVSEVRDAEPLTNWLERKTDDPAIRLKVMEAYGSLMASFHKNCYSNRDLKHENVMCSKENPWLLQVVDLDGVRKHWFVTRRRSGKDLRRVGKSLAALGWTGKSEIMAFFTAYNKDVPPRLHRHSFPD